jgi:maleylacetoacetate isomerase
MRLYGYWRSSAAYRVRIALHWKGVEFEHGITDLRRGEHRTLTYLEKNPQGLVPMLEEGDVRLTQSLAIIEALEETRPEPPLLPKGAAERAAVRATALYIACEIHPLNNLRVLQHIKRAYGLDEAGVNAWYRHWIEQGFARLEADLGRTAGRFCHGDMVTMADVCLVPQVANARRYNCDLEPYPTIRRVEKACLELPAFEQARPERQPDAA